MCGPAAHIDLLDPERTLVGLVLSHVQNIADMGTSIVLLGGRVLRRPASRGGDFSCGCGWPISFAIEERIVEKGLKAK
jgi:hypothetical protein